MEGPQKLKLELPYAPAVPLLGICLKECTPIFIATLFPIR
jgi:hypothetical protein